MCPKIQLLNRIYSTKHWTIDDVERAHRTGPRNDNYDRTRPIIAGLHRWHGKLSVLQQRDGRKELADTLNIRVAADLTLTATLRAPRREECMQTGLLQEWTAPLQQENPSTQEANPSTPQPRQPPRRGHKRKYGSSCPPHVRHERLHASLEAAGARRRPTISPQQHKEQRPGLAVDVITTSF